MDAWLRDNLVCPRHGHSLTPDKNQLACREGCAYPVIDGVPIMLLDDRPQTIDIARKSLARAHDARADDDELYIDTLGLSPEERDAVRAAANTAANDGVDPVVSFLVAATNGMAYKHLVGRLAEYPIPALRLPPGRGRVFLDLGSNWGRWCIAASRLGYRAVGLDPSLGAVMAARRVSRRLGANATYVVGDARHLPFRSAAVDSVFSYSVVQHFSREDAAAVAREIGRVMRPGATSLVQMPSRFGIRCLYHQARRRFREGTGFDVRYWSLPELSRLFSTHVGPTRFSVDCFFGIGLQPTDRRFMKPSAQLAVILSEALRAASNVAQPLVWAADSVYVTSVKGRDDATRDGRPLPR